MKLVHALARGLSWTGLILAGILGFQAAGLRAQGNEEPDRRFELGAELRSRAETRIGSGMDPETADGFATSRLRFDVTVRPRAGLKIYLQAEDSRAAGLAAGRNRQDFRNPLDLHQAFVAVGRQDGPVTLYAGRQELDFLDSRLLGSRAWNNVSPSWDGSKLTLRRGEDSAHFLALSQVDIRDGLDYADRSRFVVGAVGSIRSWTVGQSIEPFYLVTGRPAEVRSNLGGLLRTAGSRFSGGFAEVWDYQVLLAAQGGETAGLAKQAWMGVWALGRTIDTLPASPRLGFEWSYASGDRDPSDSRSGTFDPLYPSPHRHYGEQDIVSIRNLKYLDAGVDLHPRRTLQVSVNFIDFRLASLRDGVYQTGNFLQVQAPQGGAASGSIGSELDVVVSYRPAARFELKLGVSRFFAGPFVMRNLPGGESQTFLNTSLTVQL